MVTKDTRFGRANSDTLALVETKDVTLADTLNLGIIRWSERKPDKAIEIYAKARPRFDASPDLLLRAKFHNNLALAYKRKAEMGGGDEHYELAASELTRAEKCLEGLEDFAAVATVQINRASLLFTLGRFEEAHALLDQGEEALELFREPVILAQALETRARCFYAQKDYRRAAIAINRSEALLLPCVELDPLTETLKTKRMIGRALEAQVCLGYGSAKVASKRFGIKPRAVRRKIKEYFG